MLYLVLLIGAKRKKEHVVVFVAASYREIA